MRNMSFELTKEQMYARIKTVTRRLGWWVLEPGDIVMACEKCQGLKKGEKIKRIYPIKIISVRAEPLKNINKAECIREGFGNLEPKDFIDMFISEMRCAPYTIVNRIEFKESEAVDE